MNVKDVDGDWMDSFTCDEFSCGIAACDEAIPYDAPYYWGYVEVPIMHPGWHLPLAAIAEPADLTDTHGDPMLRVVMVYPPKYNKPPLDGCAESLPDGWDDSERVREIVRAVAARLARAVVS